MDQGDAGGHQRRGRGGGGRGRGRGTGRGRGRGRSDTSQTRFSGNSADCDTGSAVGQNPDEGQSSGSARPRRPRKLGYKSVEALLQENPSELVFKLASSQSGFIELLNETDIRRDLMALVINVISTTCKHSSTSQSLFTLLNKVYTDSEFFTRHLTQYVMKMTIENQPKYRAIIPEQIQNIITILTCMLQRLPSSVNHVNVVVILLNSTFPALEDKGILLDQDVKNALKRLVEFKDELGLEEKERINRPRQRQQRERESTGPPPDDFRQIQIFPTVGDFSTEVEPYLRKNITAGGYTDVDEYLDVQFRLLREDFIEPLRSGIREYQLMRRTPPVQRNQRPKDIRIYHDVEIQYPMCSRDSGIIHRVHFDQTKFTRLRWQNSKRMIFGSLVCLSRDDFQTFVFATVADRKPEDLEQGFVDLRFENREMLEEMKTEKFVMAESSAYFEAYRHVLEGLQQITRRTLPLQNYIINVTKQVDAPEYLRTNPRVRYDLSPLVSNTQELNDDSNEEDDIIRGLQRLRMRDRKWQSTRASAVRIMDTEAWPTEEDLHLDSSQLEAVQMALTKELSVIQGPPGTGKTYIGLKIVQALLHNSRVWSNEDDVDDNGTQMKTRPLLIVCFTNHALDQFLEGILKFQAKDIVRIGGRSSSDILKSYNLNNIRQGVRKRRETQRYVHERCQQIISEMMGCKQPMEMAQTRIAMTRHAILNEDNLRPYMLDRHYHSLIYCCPEPQTMREISTSKMLLWLGLTGNFHVQREDIFQQLDMGEDRSLESYDEMEIDEEADLLEEQRIIDDQDFADRNIHKRGYDARREFSLDIDTLEKEEDENEPRKEFRWKQVQQRKSRIKQIIKRNLQSKKTLSDGYARTITNVWTIPDMPTRWQLYRYWLVKYQDRQAATLFENQENYERLAGELKEIRTEEDLNILNGAKVIGMTTTGAAKYRSMLQRIKPKIIVVEEAAEVLESHIITTLSEDCQQLILIGDHQQLRPNPTVYRLAKDFNLDISLFERMVNNGLPCQKLTQQHRMRPEISAIMKLSHFYPPLLDHSSVKQFEDIMGISSNVFFLDHDQLEAHIDDTKSHSNKHEAEFLVALTRYFLQQGYAPSQITILTTYTAQLFQFKNLMKKSLFKGVRVSAVDNFQGEENDIILLSLVRSNEEGSIGFLKVANRVCVALSRARKGLFCIGNFSLLSKQGQMWKDIVALMKRKGTFSTRMKLVCHNHPDTATEVSLSTDFIKVPEGGCNKPCETRLNCGHACAMPCHPRDPQHVEYKCLKPCTKAISGCPMKHKCSKFCYQQCIRKCTTPVSKCLPCGHTATVPCHKDVMEVVCQEPCVKPLHCGHLCMNKCGDKCATHCQVKVIRKDLPCGHQSQMTCSAEAEDCPHPCGMALLCGHRCTGTCGRCQRGRLHMPCRQYCGRTLVCGHSCEEPCTKTCPPCKKRCQNRCIHSKCPRNCGDPCSPCNEQCEWQCIHKKCTKPCGEPCNRKPCNKPCPKKLRRCSHKCIGICGEPCPTKCRICDKEEVTEILFGDEDEPDARFVQLEDCGHVIEVQASDNWMSMAVTGEMVDIQLRACPRCKTTIRKNLRYGNIIKKMLADIEIVKGRMFGDKNEIHTRTKTLRSDIREAWKSRNKLSADVLSQLARQIEGKPTLEEVVLQENLFNLLSMIQTIRKKAEEGITHKDNLQNRKSIQHQLNGFEKWLMRPRFRMSEQELEDVSRELNRLSQLTKMVVIDCQAREQGKQDDLNVQTDLTRAKDTLTNGFQFTDDAAKNVQKLLDRVGKLVGGLSISDEERVSILKAMGMSKGHWFKCPNGHIYAIGDCGGATIESTCPDCKARIGGSGYKLRDDNKLASEMDQASHPAWSEQANMMNYQFP